MLRGGIYSLIDDFYMDKVQVCQIKPNTLLGISSTMIVLNSQMYYKKVSHMCYMVDPGLLTIFQFETYKCNYVSL